MDSLFRGGPKMGGRRVRHPRRRLRLLLIGLSSPLFILASFHACAAVLHRANSLGRRCMLRRPPHPTPPPRIAIVSFSDESAGPRRSFLGLMDLVGENKRRYAAAKGYAFIDAGGLVDPSRPPNWSKIPAVRSHLHGFDWVFWNDADTVVTNPQISLEDVLQDVIGHADFYTLPDLVVTEDINGINSGVFFVRRSAWSQNFLATWWNQTHFVRFGSPKSGDNAAMAHLIGALPPDEFKKHVRVAPMQCLFNSYPWFPTWKSAFRLLTSPISTWTGAYSPGDFMVHLAGLDEKTRWAAKFLGEVHIF